MVSLSCEGKSYHTLHVYVISGLTQYFLNNSRVVDDARTNNIIKKNNKAHEQNPIVDNETNVNNRGVWVIHT